MLLVNKRFIKFNHFIMKTQILALLSAFVLFSFSSFAQAKKVNSATLKVWGNCGMCKARIEKAAKAAGASTAVWNEDSKMLTYKYASAATAKKVEAAVAQVGHDTENMTAPDAVYAQLHECCKYDRKSATAKSADACCADKEKCTKDCCKASVAGTDAKMDCCKDKEACAKQDCCKKTDATAMTCCKDKANCGKEGCCKPDMSCCKTAANGKMDCCKDGKSCCAK